MSFDCLLSIRDESGTYYRNAYITILSLFENTASKLRVHILHDDTLTDQGRNDLQALAHRYAQELLFHRVPDFDPDVAATIKQWFNLGAMYRYFATDFIDAEVAAYLDCDIILNRDIKDLFDVPLNGALIAAVQDLTNYWDRRGRVRKRYIKKIEFLKLKPEDCFDSGVMLMNLKRFRELNGGGNILMEKTLAALDVGVALEHPDQDILNALCAEVPNGLLHLDESFNFMVIRARTLDLSAEALKGRIVQFIAKPTESFFPAHLLFWKYYLKTPFADDMFEQMDAAFRNKRMKFLIAYARHPQYRRSGTELLMGGFGGLARYYFGRLFKGSKR